MPTRFGFVSTYPPTQCGLATFTAALRGALTESGTDCGTVVRLVDPSDAVTTGIDVTELAIGDRSAIARAVIPLNECDVVIVQHEFGIYGGRDGDDVLTLLEEIRVPTIVVLHTVLVEPTAHQRQVLEAVVAATDAVVTMTTTARNRLAGYTVDLDKVSIIAHGAPDLPAPKVRLSPVFNNGQPTVLTWGLLGPGKGLEWGIEAMALLADVRPSPRYIIAGQTHPKVLAHHGDAYRESLVAKVRQLGLSSTVSFDPHYRDGVALADLVQSADVILLPYDSRDQVTSGVLIEAVAAGKPVVATGFPHAVELLADGAGLVVAHRDPTAIAAALRQVITQPGLAAQMGARASAAAPRLLWPAVAEEYRILADRLVSASIAA